MTIERIDPPGLAPLPGAAHVTVARGSRIIHISGQTGVDGEGNPVGTTHSEQTRQALINLRTACEAADASLADVAMLHIYVVDYSAEAFDALVTAAIEVYGDDFPITASTLVPVPMLWQPGLLIEIDATIVAD
jgi:enamine deaminase RidA (YjgF/YER057c/UK114 family)